MKDKDSSENINNSNDIKKKEEDIVEEKDEIDENYEKEI